MKKLTTLFVLFLATISYSQKHLDYSQQLRNYKGINTIDGSKINSTARFANITTDRIKLSHKSAITFVNCFVKVNGPVDASNVCRIRLLNSYIICKSYNGPKSDRIIVTKNIDVCTINKIKYLNKLKGNPNIEIIDKLGKVIAKGNKESLSLEIIETGVYDVRSPGNFYDSGVLLANR